jgi:hypothetical protein
MAASCSIAIRNLLAFGAILRHRPSLDQDEEVGKAAGQRQQSAPSQFGAVLMVSEGGRFSFSSEGSLHLDALSFRMVWRSARHFLQLFGSPRRRAHLWDQCFR